MLLLRLPIDLASAVPYVSDSRIDVEPALLNKLSLLTDELRKTLEPAFRTY